MDELATAPWSRRLALRVHLLACRHCRRYAAQIRAIGRAVRGLFPAHDTDPEAVQRLEERILRGAPGPGRGSEGIGDGSDA